MKKLESFMPVLAMALVLLASAFASPRYHGIVTTTSDFANSSHVTGFAPDDLPSSSYTNVTWTVNDSTTRLWIKGDLSSYSDLNCTQPGDIICTVQAEITTDNFGNFISQ
jgi:hypothetical protein